MDLYARKRKWKWLLFVAALLIFGGTFLYTNHLVNKVRSEEQKNLRIWADAVNRKSALVNYTDFFFRQIKDEERRRVEILAGVYRRLATAEDQADLTFYLEMIEKNKTIPVVLTDEGRNILSATNVSFDRAIVKKLDGTLLEKFSLYPPIEVRYMARRTHYLYYTDSRLFTELQDVLNDLNQSFINEVVTNAASVPVLITDSTRSVVISSGNVDSLELAGADARERLIRQMESENDPISINLSEHGRCFVFYRNSYLMTQLRYYPFVQLSIIGLFLIAAYLLFSYARKSEQDQVWVGMSKETAHQLGTPMSSMMAWIELLRMDGIEHPAVPEMEKDLHRLEIITERFSKIGSKPQLEPADLGKVIRDTIDYLKTRTSRKIHYVIEDHLAPGLMVPLNAHLFEWVIENLVKNAVDAMNGAGTFTVTLSDDPKNVFIDLADTGKGIPRSQFGAIFQPGFTSKKRGWGLGLSLARRIIHSYHRGKIFVKSSQPNAGATFRIVLRKR